MHTPAQYLHRCLATGIILASLPLTPATAESELQRLAVGPLRLYFTEHGPSSLHFGGRPLIRRLYFYTAVKDESGTMIEGFNFRRNEDGFLKFSRQDIPGGQRLTWKNRRYIYDRKHRKTGRLAGEATVTLTMTRDEVAVRYQGDFEPNEGFGEIGFYLPESALTGGKKANFAVGFPGGKERQGTLPLPDNQPRDILSGFSSLRFQSHLADYEWTFTGTDFPGSNGLHFQDFRRNDSTTGCYRIVLSMTTKGGNLFDYSWRLRVNSRGAQTPPAGPAQPPAPPVRRLPDIRAQLGDARPVQPRSSLPTAGDELTLDITEGGRITIREGDVAVIEDEYFQLFPARVPQRSEHREAGGRHVILRYESPQGTLVKDAIVYPDEAWMSWQVTARRQLRGEVGFFSPASRFASPCITYRSINQSMVEEKPRPELISAYCILAGGAKGWREFQCGTSGHGDWQFQDFTAKRERYRFVAVPRLEPGQRWRAVFHYLRRPPEPYPQISFDQTREERGILATLLPDAIEDGFTIVPARSAKYAYAKRPVIVRMKCYSRDRKERAIDISCRLVNMWGREVSTRDYSLRSGGEPFAAVQFPVTVDAHGAYRLEITYRSGEIERTREIVFTVMPEVPDTGLRPGSVFGAALGGGDYLGTLAKRIGLKWNRCHCAIGDTQCGNVQPERGAFDWAGVDAACDFHQRFQFYACHSISEGWKAPWLSALWKQRPFDEYLDAYIEEYVKPLARRYKERIRCWEVTNEPYYQFKECPEKWVELMKRTYQALKEIDPNCIVVGTCGPPGSMGYSWYRRTFALGSLNYQDVVSSHLYHWGPWVGSGVAIGVRKWIRDIRAVMKEYGKVLPLWNTETTVSPPASMYTHPTHTRYCRYHPGEKSTDPIEQSQVYFKVLVVHKAENVKYSFHIFHGGVEYTSHTGEYDETPLAFLAAQAALAKHLELADYVEDLKFHDEVQCFLFRHGKRLILIPWGPRFLKDDRADIILPVPASRFSARDIFDNPLPVEGDERETRLAVSWEAFFQMTDSLTVDELRAAVRRARVTVRLADSGPRKVRGTFQGKDAGLAGRAAWVGFFPVDLSAVANRSFTDEEPGDGRGGWTDEGNNDMRFLPTGDWVANGVPFHLIDPAENDGKSCIVLKGGVHPNAPFPERVVIPVHQRLSKLHFLHTTTWGTRGGEAFRYVLRFSDGYTEEVAVNMRDNVGDWWWLGDPPNAKLAWEGPNPVREKVRLWQAEHEIGHPKGAQAMLDSIEIVSAGKRPIPVVIAITGVFSN